MPNVTRSLTIALRDEVSGPAAKAVGALHKLGLSEKELERAAKAPSVQRLTADLGRLNAQAGKMSEFRAASRALDASSTAMRAARQSAAALAKAIAEAEKPTTRMRVGLRAAEADVARTTGEFRRQGEAVRELRAALSGAGVPLNGLAAAEAHVKAGVTATTAACGSRSRSSARPPPPRSVMPRLSGRRPPR